MKNDIVVLLVIVAILFLFSNLFGDLSQVDKVKKGEVELYCHFKDGYRKVDPDKVIGINDEAGYWLFTNGYAKIENCDIR